MPQHPQYSNSPKRDLVKLFELLNELESFGFVHEEIHQVIDAIMNELYKKPSAHDESVTSDENEFEDEDEDEDEDDFDMSASSLFYEISAADRCQYIQDLRNVIAHCISSNSWSTDGVAEQIISMRDLEYYQMHVRMVEDTETLEKYEYSKRTQWFGPDIKPSKVGIYEVAKSEWDIAHDGFAYWDGNTWREKSILLSESVKQPKVSEYMQKRAYYWRGFADKQDDVI